MDKLEVPPDLRLFAFLIFVALVKDLAQCAFVVVLSSSLLVLQETCHQWMLEFWLEQVCKTHSPWGVSFHVWRLTFKLAIFGTPSNILNGACTQTLR